MLKPRSGSMLFEDKLKADQRIDDKHLAEMNAVIDRAPAPGALSGSSSRSRLSYYRDERFLTMYSLEAIDAVDPLQRDRVEAIRWRELLLLAFEGRFPDPKGTFPFPDQLHYEHVVPQPPAIAETLRARFANGVNHPCLDIQQRAESKLKGGRDRSRWEGPTHVDARVVWSRGSFKHRLYVEAKFLSDVSVDTTYNIARNQIARTIEAGLWDTTLELDPTATEIAPEALEHFWFMLLTPRALKVDYPRARLYGYLMDEYRQRPETLLRDLPHLELDWDALSTRLGWASWEDARRFVDAYQHNSYHGVKPVHLEASCYRALSTFFDQRHVLVPRLLPVSIEQAVRAGTLSSSCELVEDLSELKLRLRRGGARQIDLGERDGLTGHLTFQGLALGVEELMQEHLDWATSDRRFLQVRV